jgi:hypothetical protein
MRKDRGRIDFGMNRTKRKKVEDHWKPSAFLKSIQLTPEQKAEVRAEAQKAIDRARADGVYERLIRLHERSVRERSVSMVAEGDHKK